MANTPFLRAFSPVLKTPEDAKWKNYSAAVEQSLKGWDGIKVWADYVMHLQKLDRTLKTSPAKFKRIPHEREVARKLAQCLQPHISSGVRLKAIDVYNVVFDLLDDRLANEVAIWLPGIADLFSMTDTSTMHPTAALFKRLIETLPSLRTVLKPLILALLAGLEDESIEIFGTVLRMMDDVKVKVNDDSHFWQCFFLAVISSPSRRMGALAWAQRRFPKFSHRRNDPEKKEANGDEAGEYSRPEAYQLLDYEAQMAINPDAGLMVRALCTGLRDENLLVQRGFMELLVQNVQLDSAALQVIANEKDVEMLCIAACSTALKRETSLNKRLWAWLLGPEPDTTEKAPRARSTYFIKYASQHLVSGLLDMINTPVDGDPGTRTVPYRLCVSILDKWEIGGVVIPRVLVPAIKSVKQYGEKNPDTIQEVLSRASVLFDATETINIGHDLFHLVLSSKVDDLILLEYIVDNFHVNDDEVRDTHLPLILLALLLSFDKFPEKKVWERCVDKLIDIIPGSAYEPASSEGDGEDQSSLTNLEQTRIDDEELYKVLKSYYDISYEDNDVEKETKGPLSPQALASGVLQLLESLAIKYGDKDDDFYEKLARFLAKVPEFATKRNERLVEAFISSGKGVELFPLVLGCLTPKEVSIYVTTVLQSVWQLLALPNSAYPVESVRVLWTLQDALDDARVESSLSRLLLSGVEKPINQLRAFSRLWTHSIDRANYQVILSRPVFLVLDKIGDAEWSLLVKAWLESVVAQRSTSKLFAILVDPVLNVNREVDDLLFKYHVDLLNTVLSTNDQVRQCYFKDVINGQSVDKLVSAKLAESLKTRTSTTTLISCIQLIENTNFDNVTIAKVLVEILPTFEDSDMGQVPVLGLLSRCVQRTKGKLSTDVDLRQALVEGLSMQILNEYTVEAWVRLLCDCLQYFDTVLLQHLIQLSGCLCSQINRVFDSIQVDHDKEHYEASNMPLVSSSFNSFVDGLEKLLVTAHELLQIEERRASVTSSTATTAKQIASNSINHYSTSSSSPSASTSNLASGESGFFGNVISGVFAVESPIAKSHAANSRLTVLLAFNDATKVAFEIWKWTERVGRSASDSDMLLCSRVKSRMRRLLVRLYNLELLETCEQLVKLGIDTPKQVCKLIHVIDGGRPKSTLPRLFSALSSRINGTDTSSVSESLSELDVALFLVDYLQSLEGDVIEDVWPDCLAFLSREVLPNYSLYKSVLPRILSMVRVIADKLSRVKYGEQRKVKRELSDVFGRLLTHTLSTRSQRPEYHQGATNSTPTPTPGSPSGASLNHDTKETIEEDQDEILTALILIVPSISGIMDSTEKCTQAYSSILSSLVAPRLKSKLYPRTLSSQCVTLIHTVMVAPHSTRVWKALVGDMVLDQRFIDLTQAQASSTSLQAVVSKWGQMDRERLKEYIYRLDSHGGSSSFISWTDSESNTRELNIKRLAYLLLCSQDTAFELDIEQLVVKIEEASDWQSYGSICLVLRAMVLTIKAQHLRPCWQLIISTLQNIFSGVLQEGKKQVDFPTLLGACKLLDLILSVGYEDFQLHEWLFICDNMDAIFRTEEKRSGGGGGLIDTISTSGKLPAVSEAALLLSSGSGDSKDKKRPLLCGARVEELSQLKPFFDQLSIAAYEQLYLLKEPDLDECKLDLIRDIFRLPLYAFSRMRLKPSLA